ncbi:phytanoyl-CoA dioxygenase family protein [Myxococcota bacterium]|nr:phytanoyl-CoA dioxygenase family protein [Myxococcota bacterium]
MKSDESTDEMARALGEAGCLVVTNAFDAEVGAEISRAMRPHLDALPAEWIEKDDPDSFYPGYTRRAIAIIERAEAAWELVMHPISAVLCESHLGPNCERHQLHVTGALEVGPGARSQILHREEDPFPIFPLPRPNLIVASMWAISDFTAENGGTRLVPGSHRWSADRVHTPDEVVSATMPAGSVLYWLGGTLHGAGANVSATQRFGLILSYSVGWVRQEENQYLSITPETVAKLSEEMQALIGREAHDALGLFDPRIIQV